MKRYRNENGLLAMVGTGEQKLLSLISLFQGRMGTVSTLRLKGRKQQFSGGHHGRWDSKGPASRVLPFPSQQTAGKSAMTNWGAERGDAQRLDVSPAAPKFHQNKLFRPWGLQVPGVRTAVRALLIIFKISFKKSGGWNWAILFDWYRLVLAKVKRV